MKILLIHQYFLEKNDGGGSRWNEITRHWASKGNSITVISGMVHYASGKKPHKYKGKWIYIDKGFYNNVDVIRTHVSEAYNKNFLGRLWAYFSFVFSGTYAGLFKCDRKYDIIVATSPPLFVGIIAYILSKFRKIPFVFEVRDLWPESAIDTGVLKNQFLIKFSFWFERFIYKRAIFINALTPAFKEKLIKEKGVSEHKITMIPNAADFSLAESLIDTLDVKEFRRINNIEDKFVITYVGAHGVANHLIQLIEVAERLRDTNVLFQLIGDGMLKEYLIDEVKTRKLENVRFIDPVPKSEVFKYILSSDVGTSVLKKNDTFKTIYSNKTFDYMACKKAVLLLIDGVSRELVETANCGVYAEPENLDDIEKKIRHLLALSKNELNLMGINGYNYAKKYFDRVTLAEYYLIKLKDVRKNR
ncbi:glycosyltransferase family 4 protein [Tenuifilum thalassicum]|uniref:Glycosyltransferase family 4 protein n=1 Tax=Tenuifilum thalassicum TaxID=2590900 RepID=A0A7D3Y4U9_9BACT|nr:glycosyltransferase family 4 protein [Tenuifilum thalassicum]QKG80229.1 glycosyltransferase family 4 protein [Tenuifilum thalassicum]